MDNEVLTWEITPNEQRERRQKTLILYLRLFWIFILGVIVLSFSLVKGEPYYIASVAGTIILIAFFWLIGLIASLFFNRFFPYQKRKYYLDNQGITIFHGSKKRHYPWRDFECFYIYTFQRSGSKRDFKNIVFETYNRDKEEEIKETTYKLLNITGKTLGKTTEEIEGKIFYLKKRKSGLLSKFYKTFIIVYSEPENSKDVEEFLSRHLPFKKMGAFTDAGLVFYKFK
jgi:hypothetical protein